PLFPYTTLFRSVQVAAFGVLADHIAPRDVPLRVRLARLVERGEGPDVAPKRLERHHDRVLGLLHDRVVDRVRGAGLKGRFVDPREIEIRCRGTECHRTDTRHVRGEVLELVQVAARPEHEHAAVPVVVPPLYELPRTPLVGLFHEPRDAKRGTARRAALDIAVSGLRAPRDDAEGHELSGLGRAERGADRLLE